VEPPLEYLISNNKMFCIAKKKFLNTILLMKIFGIL
jgi:hypothetical protein